VQVKVIVCRSRLGECSLDDRTQRERVEEALQWSEFRKAVALAAELPWHTLELRAMSHLMDAMISAAAGLSDGSEDELKAYELVVIIGDTLFQQAGVYRPAVELRVNSALFNKGVVLAQIGRTDEAIKTYDRLVSRVGGSRQPGLRESAVRALFNKGAGLASLERREEAIGVYDDLVSRYRDDPEPSMTEAVGKALINKGVALAELKRFAEAIAVLDEVVERWGDSPDGTLRRRASRALLNKAAALIQLDQRQTALTTYDEILNRFGNDSESSLLEVVTIARLGRDSLAKILN
jgi:tetratricopeptide (TPR) repeat protein